MVSSIGEHSIPALAFGGGLLIGIGAIFLYATLGRIAGVSSILFDGLFRQGANRYWQLMFLAGLVGGGWLAVLGGYEPVAYLNADISPLLLAMGGLATGFGTRIGKGCTSGHGVCGLGRLSPRSLIAVIVFMLLGFVTATWLRPWLLVWIDA